VAELPELTLAYLQQRPESAARALETVAAADSAEVLQRVPVRIAAPVVAAMTAVSAAHCAVRLPPDAAAAICAALPWADASALLRQIDDTHRETILRQLPAGMARRFRRSLVYADDTVGAWIDMDVPSIVEDRTVTEATRIIAQSAGYAASHLLLTNDHQIYTGVVPLAALLAASPTAGLATLADRECRPVRDSASLASISRSREWDSITLLPVINHRGELLGGIARRTLSRALSTTQAAPPGAQASLPAELFKAYLHAGEGLLRLLLADSAADGREVTRGEP
jgi:Mg/Co/Ni transporter MgtE